MLLRKRVMNVALLDVDDTQIVMDLREMNENPQSTKLDAFWSELGEYLEEIMTAVDERRQKDVMHMPLAISVRHLQEIITECLQGKVKYANNFLYLMDKITILAINSIFRCSTERYWTITNEAWDVDTTDEKIPPRCQICGQHFRICERVCNEA